MATAITIEALTPQRLKMSYEEYLESSDDARIVEWVNGEGIIYMPPLYPHQNIVSFLDGLLRLFIEFFYLGVLIPAPFEVKLWPGGPSREPDLVVVTKENLAGLTDRRFEGAPDLLIEIISPGSVTEDRVHKFTEYEQAGVQEYWVIDPRPHQQQADFYVLGEDKIYHAAPVDDQGVFRSTVLPHFWLQVDWLRQEQLPNPQLALAEIMVSIETLPAEIRETYQTLRKLLTGK
ncbi:MAG: Uma2 family endonuclease [Anaerolineales bacterium]|nr:Uma2 family endonuclease [Anaerolineales bacterium]